jgi:hypothetical protein
LYDIAQRGIDLRVISTDERRETIQPPLRVTYPELIGHHSQTWREIGGYTANAWRINR